MKKKRKKANEKLGKLKGFTLPKESARQGLGVAVFILAIIIGLSFFEQSGPAGQWLFAGLTFLIGQVVFSIPFILIIAGFVFFIGREQKLLGPAAAATIIFILGLSGFLSGLGPENKMGGWLGSVLSWPLLKFFGFWVTQIVFGGVIIVSGIIFWHLLGLSFLVKEKEAPLAIRVLKRVIGLPKFKMEKIPELETKIPKIELKAKETDISPQVKTIGAEFQPPPLDLLEKKREIPTAGDTGNNSTIIKKTLENFDIPVEMSEINIGPTVTQYTFKPAEGIKLSKIVGLTNDLSLALACHPIRIEAPIPGKSLVGVEVPNKSRAHVRLRDLIVDPGFQKSGSNLNFVLGQDVSGRPVYADLNKMPHLLVAGSTGTGKTNKADTLLFTERGMLTFEELHPLPLNSEADFEIKVVSRDGIEATKKIYNNGICQFYKLSTRRGYQVEATAEHPLWVMNEDGSQSWKPASLIKEGDYVAISRGPALFGNKTDISDFQPSRIRGSTKKISFPSKITPQLAQFLGFLTADGGLSIERKGIHRVTYTQANRELLSLYKKSLKELFGVTQFIEKTSGSNPNNKAKEIVVNSMHLKEFLSYLGMDSVKSPRKVIPRAIREAPKEEVRAYLRALVDNDGYVGKEGIELSLSSEKLISQVQLILLNFGIISSVKVKKIKKYAQVDELRSSPPFANARVNEYFRLSIYGEEARKFIKEIGFIRKEKYKKAKEFLKLSSNPNLDLIPNVSHLLKTLGQKYLNSFARLTNRGWKYQSGILVPKHVFSSLRTYNSGFRAPGYQSLEKILDFYQPIAQEPEYQELEKISQRNFYWDKIEKINRTSGVGYDFFVPGSDSFIGNGFVNHNTIFLNSLILSLLYKNSPETLRIILIDPKRVEFSAYQGLPHLLTPVIFDPQKTINTLKWLILEMERRFDILSGNGSRNISSYNEKILKEKGTSIPYIVLIVDELADLMASRGREMEAGIVRLAQMARAVGIHLVMATQRPSVEVITGLIKANISSRITFQVASQVDSRTVLDMAGAEKLLGAGDLLFISAEVVKPRRIQGAYVTEKEVQKVVNYIKAKTKEEISGDEGLEKTLVESIALEDFHNQDDFLVEDPLYEEAKRQVMEAKKASSSLLQRRLRIGYARAARLLDALEKKGVVGPGEGAKPREVYMKTAEENEENKDWQKI